MNITGYAYPRHGESEHDVSFRCCKTIVVIKNPRKIVFVYITISLKARTFSAHGEGGNSVGIDGRGKLAYNELFLTHVVTTCSIRQYP